MRRSLIALGLVAMVLMIPPLRLLYGSLPLLIIAVVLFRFPLGVHFIKSGLMQVSKELEEASTVCGTGWLATQQRITLPDGKQLGVTIPEGVHDGQTLRLKGLGHPGRGDAPAGDALIEIHIRPHPQFERKGDDVVSELAIGLDEAVLGERSKHPPYPAA